MNRTVPPPDKRLVLHCWVEIAVLAVSAFSVLAAAVGGTAITATTPNPEPAQVVLVAWLGAVAALAVAGAAVGIGNARGQIRRARR